MTTITVKFVDAGHLSQEDRDAAEGAYEKELLAAVPNISILQAIRADDIAAMLEGVSHFEKCESAWSELDRIGQTAAEKAIGFWPKESAHFEVSFGA